MFEKKHNFVRLLAKSCPFVSWNSVVPFIHFKLLLSALGWSASKYIRRCHLRVKTLGDYPISGPQCLICLASGPCLPSRQGLVLVSSICCTQDADARHLGPHFTGWESFPSTDYWNYLMTFEWSLVAKISETILIPMTPSMVLLVMTGCYLYISSFGRMLCKLSKPF